MTSNIEDIKNDEEREQLILLLSRIKNISTDQLYSDQVERMLYLIKETGFELHREE